VKGLVTKSDGGAGPTLADPIKCGSTGIASGIHENGVPLSPVAFYTNGNISIPLHPKKGEPIRLSLIDLSGRTVAARNYSGNNNEMAPPRLNIKKSLSGAYILLIHAGNRLTKQKVFIN
jgi:hypothetical protein